MVRKLVSRFSSVEDFCRARPEELQSLLGRSAPAMLQKLLSLQHADPTPAILQYPYVTQEDPEYPAAFRCLSDPPCLFFYRGDLGLFSHRGPWVGVVGTRAASRYALQVCRQIVERMKFYDPMIVSGMALGIDGRAHQGALEAGMKTVGILGTPIDWDYPLENAPLFKSVEKHGLLLAELPPEAPMAPWRFLERNRLIAALVDVLVIIEAPEKSGALATAREALELGKDIYVVPGRFDLASNLGGHRLVQDGANLLLDVDELFKGTTRLPAARRNENNSEGQSPIDLSEEAAKILGLFGEETLHIDKIMELSDFPPPQVSGIIMNLVLYGRLRELPGSFFEILTS